MTDAAAAVMVCAGGELNKDACQGDSGGPLSYDSSGQHQLVCTRGPKKHITMIFLKHRLE